MSKKTLEQLRKDGTPKEIQDKIIELFKKKGMALDSGAGYEIENYKELCKILGWKPIDGRTKKLRVEFLQKCINISKVPRSNKYFISGVKELPKAINKRHDPKQTLYADDMYKILLLYIYIQERVGDDPLIPENEDDVLSIYIYLNHLKALLGLATRYYISEGKFVSQRTRWMKKHYFYIHNRHATDVLTDFYGYLSGPRYSQRLTKSAGYIIYRNVVVDKFGNKYLLTFDKDRKDNKEKESEKGREDSDQKINDNPKTITNTHKSNEASSTLQKNPLFKLIPKSQLLKETEKNTAAPEDEKPRGLKTEAHLATEKEEIILKRCIKETCDVFEANDRIEVKYMGKIKQFDEICRQKMEQFLYYSYYKPVCKFSMTRKDVWTAAQAMLVPEIELLPPDPYEDNLTSSPTSGRIASQPFPISISVATRLLKALLIRVSNNFRQRLDKNVKESLKGLLEIDTATREEAVQEQLQDKTILEDKALKSALLKAQREDRLADGIRAELEEKIGELKEQVKLNNILEQDSGFISALKDSAGINTGCDSNRDSNIDFDMDVESCSNLNLISILDSGQAMDVIIDTSVERLCSAYGKIGFIEASEIIRLFNEMDKEIWEVVE